MAIYLGYERAGWKGLIAGGICFIMPALLIVLTLSWLYVHFRSTPQAVWLLYGIKPVVVAIIVQALWGLFKNAIKGPMLAALALLTLILYLGRFSAVALIFGSGILVMCTKNLWRMRRGKGMNIGIALLQGLGLPVSQIAGIPVHFSLTSLFLIFLKIGSVVFGSGYLLLAFLRNDFVHRLGWLTDQQVLDAVAIGQFTPGPVFTTATFIGFILGGFHGALLATVGIFLPSFLFVAAVFPLVGILRQSQWAGAFLDGVIVVH